MQGTMRAPLVPLLSSIRTTVAQVLRTRPDHAWLASHHILRVTTDRACFSATCGLAHAGLIKPAQCLILELDTLRAARSRISDTLHPTRTGAGCLIPSIAAELFARTGRNTLVAAVTRPIGTRSLAAIRDCSTILFALAMRTGSSHPPLHSLARFGQRVRTNGLPALQELHRPRDLPRIDGRCQGDDQR